MLNLVILKGRVVRDATLAKTQSGTPVLPFSIAVQRKGNKDKADFFDCVAWSALAERYAGKLWKGRTIEVIGSLQNHDYEDKNGVKKRRDEIAVSEIYSSDWGQKTEASPDEGGLPF